MIDPSELPPDIQHLIEKRERADRRSQNRRGSQERRELDLGPLGAASAEDDLEDLQLDERRSGQDRRTNRDRRQTTRRRTESESDE